MIFFSRSPLLFYLFSFLFLQSCGSIDYVSSMFFEDKAISDNEVDEKNNVSDEQLKSDNQQVQTQVQVQEENITQDQNSDISKNNNKNEILIEESSESLTASPTREYESSIIVENDNPIEQISRDNVVDEAELNEAELNEENLISDLDTTENIPSPIFSPTLVLKNKLQYRVATLSFKTGSSNVDQVGLKKIRKIVELAKKRDAKVKIIGHASTRTKDMPAPEHKVVNFVISDKRAQSVAKAFIDLNFPKEKLLTEAVSDSKPLFKENMPAGTQANQRTEIFLIY